jgi:hypothetical protein
LGVLIEQVSPMAFIPVLFLDISLALLVLLGAWFIAENPARAPSGV